MTINVPLSVVLETDRAIKQISDELRDLSFRSTIPGGYASCEMSLDRPLNIQADEIAQYGKVKVIDDRSGQTIWEGRLKDPGRGATDQGIVWSLTAIGPSGHALDTHTPLVYVDRRLGDQAWFKSSFSNNSAGVFEFASDELIATIKIHVPRNTVVTIGEVSDIFSITYQEVRAARQKLARIQYTWDTGVTDSNWRVKLVSRVDDGASTGSAVNDAANTAGATRSAVIGDTNFNDGDNVVDLRLDRDGASTTVNNDNTWVTFRSVSIRSMLVDVEGDDITTGYTVNTVFAHEVIKDLLGRILNQYDGPNANVEDTTFAINQLVYPDGVTPAEVLDDLMTFEPTFYWAAWESNEDNLFRFEWREWPTHVRYDVTADDGFESPESADELFNEVLVRYRNTIGYPRTVIRTQVVPVLDDLGIVRRGFIDLGDNMASEENAIHVGDQFLEDHSVAPNAGRLRIARKIFDRDTGRMVDPWEIVPGHLIRVQGVVPRIDALNPSTNDGVSIFRVVNHEYNVSDSAATLELDTFAPSVARLLANLARDLPSRGRRRRR